MNDGYVHRVVRLTELLDEERKVRDSSEYLASGVARDVRFVDELRGVISDVRAHYDESIFPPRPAGPHTEVYDGEAAAVARLTCDNILRELNEGF